MVAGSAGQVQVHADARLFFLFNVIGGLVWTVGVTLLGYALGRSISNVDRYILPGVVVIVAASFIPVLVQVLRSRRRTGESAGAGTGSVPAGSRSEKA